MKGLRGIHRADGETATLTASPDVAATADLSGAESSVHVHTTAAGSLRHFHHRRGLKDKTDDGEDKKKNVDTKKGYDKKKKDDKKEEGKGEEGGSGYFIEEEGAGSAESNGNGEATAAVVVVVQEDDEENDQTKASVDDEVEEGAEEEVKVVKKKKRDDNKSATKEEGAKEESKEAAKSKDEKETKEAKKKKEDIVVEAEANAAGESASGEQASANDEEKGSADNEKGEGKIKEKKEAKQESDDQKEATQEESLDQDEDQQQEEQEEEKATLRVEGKNDASAGSAASSDGKATEAKKDTKEKKKTKKATTAKESTKEEVAAESSGGDEGSDGKGDKDNAAKEEEVIKKESNESKDVVVASKEDPSDNKKEKNKGSAANQEEGGNANEGEGQKNAAETVVQADNSDDGQDGEGEEKQSAIISEEDNAADSNESAVIDEGDNEDANKSEDETKKGGKADETKEEEQGVKSADEGSASADNDDDDGDNGAKEKTASAKKSAASEDVVTPAAAAVVEPAAISENSGDNGAESAAKEDEGKSVNKPVVSGEEEQNEVGDGEQNKEGDEDGNKGEEEKKSDWPEEDDDDDDDDDDNVTAEVKKSVKTAKAIDDDDEVQEEVKTEVKTAKAIDDDDAVQAEVKTEVPPTQAAEPAKKVATSDNDKAKESQDENEEDDDDDDDDDDEVKLESQIETKIENEIERAIEKGKVDELEAQELEEQLDEAIEEGVAQEFEKELEVELGEGGSKNSGDENGGSNSGDEKGVGEGEGGEGSGTIIDAAEGSSGDATKEVGSGSSKGKIATIPLTYDASASSVLVDDPPIVGEFPTASKKKEEFDNLDCQDHPENDEGTEGVCEQILAKEGGCEEELFVIDLNSSAPAGGGGDGISATSSVMAGDAIGDVASGTLTNVAAATGGEAGNNLEEAASVETAANALTGMGNLRVEEEIETAEPQGSYSDDERRQLRRRLEGENGWSADSDDDDKDADGNNGSEGGSGVNEANGWSADSDDVDKVNDVEVASSVALANAKSASASNDVVMDDASDNKIVVTVGSRYCPATCNMVPQCERARDHFKSLKSPVVSEEEGDDGSKNDNNETVATEVVASDDSTDGSVPADADGSVEGTIAVKGGEETATVTAENEGAEEAGEGSDFVSEGKVSEPPVLSTLNCEADDADFVYKDKPGFTCAFIAENKPDKCFKLHDGEKVGVVSCPVSCNMVEECEELKKQQSAMNNVSDDMDSDDEGGDNGDDVGVDGEDGAEALIDTMVGNSIADEEGGVIGSQDDETVNEGIVDESPSELAGKATAVAVVCEDDPDFLYKDKAGLTCAFIAENKPDKCFKLHDGEKVGVVSCPVSCNMVQECQEMYNVGGVVMSRDSSDVVDEEDLEGEETSLVAGEVGSEGASKDADAAVLETEEAGDIVTETPTTVSGLSPNGWSADSSDDQSPSATDDCKDDPEFLYKDKEGYDCAFLGANKPEKCLKLHLGVEIGIKSCPESCEMVDKCLEAEGAGTVAGTKEMATLAAEEAATTTVAPAAKVGLEGGADSSFVGYESTDDDNVDGNSYNSANEMYGNEEDGTQEGNAYASFGTKSMADELDNNDGFGSEYAPGGNLEQNASLGSAYEKTDDYVKNDDYTNNDSMDYQYDSTDQNGNEMGDNYGELGQGNDWGSAQSSSDLGLNSNINDWDNGDEWKEKSSQDEMGMNNENYEWGDNNDYVKPAGGYDSDPTWENTANNIGSASGGEYYQGGENAYNVNPVPVPTNNIVSPATAPTNDPPVRNSWEYDDDDDGFPTGLTIALLAIFVLYVYRKIQNRDQHQRDCTSRGGYQRVQPADHSKRW